jgi:hypothetical protein
MQHGLAIMENILSFSYKIRGTLTYDAEIPALYPSKLRFYVCMKTMMQFFFPLLTN